MLTKEQFIDTLKFMSEKYEQQNKFSSLLEEMSNNSGMVCAFIYAGYDHVLLDLLKTTLNDKDDDISYFLYELDGIIDIDKVIPDKDCPRWEDKILYNSASTLYDYLISNYKRG